MLKGPAGMCMAPEPTPSGAEGPTPASKLALRARAALGAGSNTDEGRRARAAAPASVESLVGVACPLDTGEGEIGDGTGEGTSSEEMHPALPNRLCMAPGLAGSAVSVQAERLSWWTP
jgi:hypothetical protein